MWVCRLADGPRGSRAFGAFWSLEGTVVPLCKDYLAELIGNTEGHVVADLVNGLTHSIGQAARGTNPALQDDPNFPEFRMSRERGPLVSTEEQRVWGGRARGSRVIPETDPIFRLASDEGVACNGS